MNSTIKVLVFCFSLGSYSFSVAQTRDIQIYQVVVKTKDQRHVGVLEKVNQKGVFLEKRNQKHIVIPAFLIKNIRIKPQRETRTIAVPSLEPKLKDRNHDGTLTDAYLQDTPSLGQEVGNVITTTAAMSALDAISNSFQSLKTFDINYSNDDYLAIIHELGSYSINFQSSPEYESKVLKSLSSCTEDGGT